jgi:hypothetical protein
MGRFFKHAPEATLSVDDVRARLQTLGALPPRAFRDEPYLRLMLAHVEAIRARDIAAGRELSRKARELRQKRNRKAMPPTPERLVKRPAVRVSGGFRVAYSGQRMSSF